jgi:hypothetical protein
MDDLAVRSFMWNSSRAPESASVESIAEDLTHVQVGARGDALRDG